MFGSDKCNVTRNQGARSQSNVSAVKLIRGGSPAGCGSAGKDVVPDPNGVLVGVSDTLEGGASQPGVADFSPPPAYVTDLVWRDEDLTLVQDNDSAISVVDNA